MHARPAVMLVCLLVLSFACGGGETPADVTSSAAAASGSSTAGALAVLEFSKWNCDTSRVEFLSDGRCIDHADKTWTCKYTQTGNNVRIDWAPGPNTAGGNEPQWWELRLVDAITMGGKIHSASNADIDWRCTLDIGDYLR